MPNKSVETSVFSWGDRYTPKQMLIDQAKALEASGVVDGLTIPDHIVHLIPPSLWTPENTPMANVIADPDSLLDAVVMGMTAHFAAPSLRLNFAGDPVRKNPADICQTMLSLAAYTEGNVRFQFGPGEVKNLKPFGHKRSEGLARFRDLLRVSKALWETQGPIDYAGKYCELKKAYLGGAKRYRPEIWSMGTGPKQLDMVTDYCDGITGSSPAAWSSAAHAKTEIAKIKQMLVEKGRDPEQVGIGSFFYVIVHEDPQVLEKVLNNPIIRWFAATLGRITPSDWRKEGIEPVTPEGWTYFNDLVPYDTSAEFAQDIVARTSREMVERSFLIGNVDQVAAKMQAYIDAGVQWVCPMDYTTIALDLDDAMKSFNRILDLCARLKGRPANAK